MRREFALSPAQAAAAVAWLDGDRSAPQARPAATVMLVRDGTSGVEVFLLRRRLSMAFAAGMYAFPGGGVDARDAATEVAWTGPDPRTWAEQLATSPPQARAIVCAAVRETFEECGVLLAGPPAERLPEATWEAERTALVARETALSDVLRRRGLALRSDLLRPWAHWTTPRHEPRRYDTHFLLAVLPEGQDARHVGGESDESGWWPAAEVVEASSRGELALLPPTLVTIEELAAASSPQALWHAPRLLREVMPTLERRGSDVVLVADLPDQPTAARRP